MWPAEELGLLCGRSADGKTPKGCVGKAGFKQLTTGASCFETHHNSLFSVIFTDTDACYVLCFFLLLAFHKARRRNGNLTAGKCASCMREEGWRGHITEPCCQNQISVDRNRVIFSFRCSILKFIIKLGSYTLIKPKSTSQFHTVKWREQLNTHIYFSRTLWEARVSRHFTLTWRPISQYWKDTVSELLLPD